MKVKQMNDLVARAFKDADPAKESIPPVVTPGDLFGDAITPVLHKLMDRIEALEERLLADKKKVKVGDKIWSNNYRTGNIFTVVSIEESNGMVYATCDAGCNDEPDDFQWAFLPGEFKRLTEEGWS